MNTWLVFHLFAKRQASTKEEKCLKYYVGGWDGNIRSSRENPGMTCLSRCVSCLFVLQQFGPDTD